MEGRLRQGAGQGRQPGEAPLCPLPPACSAVVWQMLLVTCGITYSCTGVGYLLSLVLEPSAAQLSAAVLALIKWVRPGLL